MAKIPRVLFVLKFREIADKEGNSYSNSGLSSGLYNSARMVKEMLDIHGLAGKKVEAKLVQVIDNNGIDREVSLFKPDVVIIEALWVVPEKFDVLARLHPDVKWIIRGHSNVPFLAGEGNAFSWIIDYVKFRNVFFATNTQESLRDIKAVLAAHAPQYEIDRKVLYFPNFYIAYDMTKDLTYDAKGPDLSERALHFLGFCIEKKHEHNPRNPKTELHVACFGAVRLLKNHLIQAVAALRYAQEVNQKLFFHINVGRVEGGGDPVLKNIRALFKDAKNAELVEHKWAPHDEFVRTIDKMDISLQVSFSETFNIVTADAVTMGVPVVVSDDISWVSSRYHADPTSTDSIVQKMHCAFEDARRGAHNINQVGLNAYNARSHIAISNAIEHTLKSVKR